MNPSVSVCCLSLLSLLSLLQLAGSKPVSDLQSLQQLLEEELLSPGDMGLDKSVFGAPGARPWDPSDPRNSALEDGGDGGDGGDALARLFKDLTRTSKRSWSRYKKGGLRSCFGVRLERIGSFSGLGC